MRRGVSWVVVASVAFVTWIVSTQMNQAQPAAAPAAETCCGTRVGVVDLVRVFNEFEQTTVLNEKMRQQRLRMGEESEARMQKIQEEEAMLDRFQQDTAEWYDQWKKYRKMRFDYKIWEVTEGDMLTENHRFWIKRTYQMAIDEIAKVAEAKGCRIVVTSEDVDLDVRDTKILLQQLINRKTVYADASVDLTNEVLTNLNAAFAKKGGAESVDFMRLDK